MTSKLTKERIEWLNYAATGLAANGTEMAMSPQDVIALTEYCLAAMGSEPVAYAVSNDFWNQGNHKQHIDGKQCDLFFPGDISHGEPFEPDDYDYVFPLYRHAQPAPDQMLCDFYEVNDWPDLVRELVKHVEQLQDSAKRNVKPWEDTFPETLLPAYIERVKQADEACRAAMLQAGTITNEDTRQMDELTMWIKRLVRSLKNANPDSKLPREAMDYLTARGLISVGDILR